MITRDEINLLRHLANWLPGCAPLSSALLTVQQLPETADGVRITLGMPVYGRWDGEGKVVAMTVGPDGAKWCHVANPLGIMAYEGSDLWSSAEARDQAMGAESERSDQ